MYEEYNDEGGGEVTSQRNHKVNTNLAMHNHPLRIMNAFVTTESLTMFFPICLRLLRPTGECNLQYLHQQLWLHNRNHHGRSNIVTKSYLHGIYHYLGDSSLIRSRFSVMLSCLVVNMFHS